MGKSEYINWATLALKNYDIHAVNIRFLRHSDNLTYQVITNDNGARYVLRLHKPLTENFADIRQQPQAIRSELIWMDVLRKEANITLPDVIFSREGDWVSSFRPGIRGPEILCSLLSWIDAEPFSPFVPGNEILATNLGRLMARMHMHASRWQPPIGFLRPSSGPEHIEKIIGNLSPGIQMGIIKEQDFAILETTADQVKEVVLSIGRSTDRFSMIHADLHTGNWLHKGDEIYPIDFSLCGFGYQLFDIATCAGSLGADQPSLRNHFLDGYLDLRMLPENYERAMEAFFIISVLGYYAFILPDRNRHDWISSHLPNVIAVTCKNFLKGEPTLLA